LIETLLLWLGISVIGANKTITKVIGHIIALVLNFFVSKKLVSKKLVFKNQPAPAD